MALSVISAILLLFPVFAFFCTAGIRDDALPARRWLVSWSTQAGMFALGILYATLDNRPITGFVRWQRVLFRVVMLLAIGCNAVLCFVAFDCAADIFLRGDGDSSAAASWAYAVVAVALNLPFVLMFVFPGLEYMVDRSTSSHPID